MGAGIAQVAAQAGHPVLLLDNRPAPPPRPSKASTGNWANGWRTASSADARSATARLQAVEALKRWPIASWSSKPSSRT
jgi:3-hydroxybutyryl-CoA dehydrogenase